MKSMNTSLSKPGSLPASISRTDHEGLKLAKRLASTVPAEPAPTIMKSYTTASEKEKDYLYKHCHFGI